MLAFSSVHLGNLSNHPQAKLTLATKHAQGKQLSMSEIFNYYYQQ